MNSRRLPRIDIVVDDSRWPSRRTLRTIIGRSVSAVTETAVLSYPANCELSLVFTGDEAMRVLNRDWRGKDKPTNVLSFPGSDVLPGETAGPMLGDIVLAFETVECEARLEGKELEHHLSHLIIHGFLHLFGYDHRDEKEAAEMELLEAKALARLGIGNPHA